jgi:hypothetical protein
MAQKSRLERFGEWAGRPFFAVSYLFFTCIQALKAGYNKAKAESEPLPLPTEPDAK